MALNAKNRNSGALSITTTGDTTGGTGYHGIKATNAGTSLTIDAATTTGGEMAFLLNIGTGALSITATTTGGISGIFAKTTGTGALSITTTGTTTGGQCDGIYASIIILPALATSRLTRPPRRAVSMAFMLTTMAPAH